MSEEEPDYASLPLEQRLVHKLWKARRDAYKELDEQFQNSASSDDDCFKIWLNSPELARKAVTDFNVVSQESAISALDSFLQYGGKRCASRTLNSVVPGLCEKALGSSRSVTKQKTTDALLMYVEYGTAQPVIELVIRTLSARSPRTVAAGVTALNSIYTAFGCPTCPPKLALDQLDKLFKHPDRRVRQEALKLSVTLRSYIGNAFETLIFPKLKHIQQEDLAKAFAKIPNGISHPSRMLKSEQDRLQKLQGQESQPETKDVDSVDADGDVDMDGYDAGKPAKPPDPYDLAEPVDVMSKIPSNLSQKLSNPKWKERVAILKDVQKACDVLHVQKRDYADFLRVLAKSLADPNIIAVTLAAQTITEMAKGLRDDFARYVSIVLGPLLERTKEKKKSVADAINEALNSCFQYGRFDEISETCVKYMSNRIPQVKVETCEYLSRCLQSITQPPPLAVVDMIMKASIKHLDESQVQVRMAVSKVIATCTKILGERRSKQYISKIAHRHMRNINSLYAKIEVKCSYGGGATSSSSNSAVQAARIRSRNKLAGVSSSQHRQSARRPSPLSSSSNRAIKRDFSTIPSKRLGSPLHPNVESNKMNLTSRSLRSTTGVMGHLPFGSSQKKPMRSNLSKRITHTNPKIATLDERELKDLRKEKASWQAERKKLETSLQQQISINKQSMEKIETLNTIIEDYKSKFAALNVGSKSKDIRLKRLQSDLDVARSRIMSLEKMRQRTDELSEASERDQQLMADEKVQSFSDEDEGIKDGGGHSELNRRISGLSLQSSSETTGSGNDVNYGQTNASSPLRNEIRASTGSSLANGLYELDSSDESWKKAAEVTNQLKARIEQMKARTRSLNEM